MSYMTFEDGTIAFPRRGPPPANVPGYEREAGDPYIFHPIEEPCTHRQNTLVRCPRGNYRVISFCVLKAVNLTPKICQGCQERSPPVELPNG